MNIYNHHIILILLGRLHFSLNSIQITKKMFSVMYFLSLKQNFTFEASFSLCIISL